MRLVFWHPWKAAFGFLFLGGEERIAFHNHYLYSSRDFSVLCWAAL